MVNEGDIVKVKFVGFDRGKVKLSMKNINQETGEEELKAKEERRIAELERRLNLEIYKVYSSDEPYNEEIVATNHITLSEAENNTSWKMPGKNLQNYLGNIYLSGIEKVILKKKLVRINFNYVEH